jgi:hypothetical protein
MSIKRATHIVLVASTVMLAVGAVPGSAARSQPSDLGSASAAAHRLGAEMRLPPSPESGSGLAAASGGGPIGSLFLIADQPVDASSPAVAYNSQREEYLVVWRNNRTACDDIYGQRVSKNGMLSGPWFAIATGCPAERERPSVAYNSQHDEYLVVWVQYLAAAGSHDIYGQRISATGQLLGGVIDIAVGAPGASRSYPAVAYASTEDKYLVAFGYYFATGSGIAARAFQSDGSPWGSFFDLEPSAGMVEPLSRLAYNRLRNEFLVVWQLENATQYDIRGRRVKMSGGAGPLGDAFWISTDPKRELYPVVAAVPRPPDGQYLVVWIREYVSHDYDIWGQRVTGVGTLEGGHLTISTSPSDERRPAVAGKDSNRTYLVAWSRILPSSTEMFGVTISSDGTRGGEYQLGGPEAWDPVVSSGPSGDFLIAFENQPSGAPNWGIYGLLWGNRVYLPLVLRNLP